MTFYTSIMAVCGRLGGRLAAGVGGRFAAGTILNMVIERGKTESPMVKFRKDDRSRRIWTLREEEIFATTLVELVARGWKSDNGFHAGYLQKIEDNIRKEFPNSDIKGTLHVTSKISAWKKSYNSMRGILSRTGVGFNPHGDFKIDCDDEPLTSMPSSCR
ncbi:uncharacterized protein LOC121745260 [Salvia splendens]|uniref:uncharacterized protein LOC121745260 n=1 Tax=Salvia splendens TaxID=180675 RepID=UPI001C260422|nr:uncharacterized protein LOC121745260 [Salvia splendens]